ncbi:MAG: anti-sigma factor [Acidimicrobiales bacterium]
MSHDEASDLLGAYALDAVDGDEYAELEEHLESCPRCRGELDGLREVAAAMGNSVEPVPEGLWSQIALRLPERQEGGEAPPMPRLTSEARSPFRVPAEGPTRRHRVMVSTIGAIAVAAAAVAVVLGIGLVHADNKVTGLQADQAAASPNVAAALRAPGHRVVTLDSSTHTEQAKVVVLPSGQGYVVSSSLPSLDDGRTYQLWAIEGNQPISLGLLGRSPGRAAFIMAGSTRPSRLSITAEPAGGSVFPTGPILATGTV